MSGGSKQDPMQALQAAQNVNPVTPPWLKTAQQFKVAEGMPGQLGGLATDLAAGGFGSYAPDLAYLQNIYDPAVAMRFGQPAPKPVTKVTTTPKKPVVADPVRTPVKAPVAPVYQPRPSTYGRNSR